MKDRPSANENTYAWVAVCVSHSVYVSKHTCVTSSVFVLRAAAGGYHRVNIGVYLSAAIVVMTGAYLAFLCGSPCLLVSAVKSSTDEVDGGGALLASSPMFQRYKHT